MARPERLSFHPKGGVEEEGSLLGGTQFPDRADQPVDPGPPSRLHVAEGGIFVVAAAQGSSPEHNPRSADPRDARRTRVSHRALSGMMYTPLESPDSRRESRRTRWASPAADRPS